MDSLDYVNNNMTEWNDICYPLIEGVDAYFISCFEAARAFSALIVEGRITYSKKIFEALVLNPMELDRRIDQLNEEIQKTLGLHNGIIQAAGLMLQFDFGDYDHALADRIKAFKANRRIAEVSEWIINDTFSTIAGNLFSSRIIEFMVGKTRIGERILGGNGRKAQAERAQEETYRHLEGILINIKTILKKELLLYWNRMIEIHNKIPA